MYRYILVACLMASASAQAASVTGAVSNGRVTVSSDKRTVYSNRPANTFTPDAMARDKVTIFDNFASHYPKGVYMVGTGNAFGGPNGDIGFASLATAFTPTANATMTQIAVGAGYIDGQRNAVLIHIYADASGMPGAELWSHKATLPNFGDCCVITTVRDPDGLPLTANTQYWIGISAAKNAADLFAAWDFNVADAIDPGLVAVDIGNGWMPSPALPNLAFGVYGK